MIRKKCSQCGLVNFAADEVCKRCGSGKLFTTLVSDSPVFKSLPKESIEFIEKSNKLPGWSYIIFLVLAVGIELLTLLPSLAAMGMRHSSNASPSNFENKIQTLILVLNLPSTMIPWLLTYFDEVFSIFYFFVPFTQIIFWTFFIAFLWKKTKYLWNRN